MTHAMQFKLWIGTNNSAFEGSDVYTETARILRVIAKRLEAGDDFYFYETLYDINGNDVGRAW